MKRINKDIMITVISRITGEKIEVPEEVINDVEKFLKDPEISYHLSVHRQPTQQMLEDEYVDKLWDLARKNFFVKEWKELYSEEEKAELIRKFKKIGEIL